MSAYLIVSTAVTDDIWLADGTHIGQKLGGAGLYAFAGLSLWCKDAVLLTGVGADFLPQYQDWFDKNGSSTAGLMVRDENTPFTNVQYSVDGERVETAKFGKEHYRKMEASPDDIIPLMKQAKGLYIFQSIPEGYWPRILEAKKRSGTKILWELNARVACPAYRDDVRAIASQCDVLSLNRREAMTMFHTENLDSVVQKLTGWNVPMVYLRLGGEGGLILRDGKVTHTPCVPNAQVVDPTGAGNSSSAAVLYGFCEGYSDLECGLMGSISAAMCIRQYGPPEIAEISCEELELQLKKLVEMVAGK